MTDSSGCFLVKTSPFWLLFRASNRLYCNLCSSGWEQKNEKENNKTIYMHIIWRKLSSLSSQQYVIAIITVVLRNLRTKVTKPPCVCLYGGLRNHPFKTIFEVCLSATFFRLFCRIKEEKKKSPKNVGVSKLLHITLWVIWRCKVREKPRTMISNCMRMRT